MYSRTKLSKYLNISLNIIVLIVSYLYIIKSFNQKTLNFDLNHVFDVRLNNIEILLIGFVLFALMVLNWLLEAIKWKILIEPIEKVSIKIALKSVLVGLFTSLFMPNRSGEWIGRIFSISQKNKSALFVHTIIGNIIQYLITFLLGVVAGLYFFEMCYSLFEKLNFNFGNLYFIISIIVLVCFFVLLFYLSKNHSNTWIKWKSHFYKSIEYLKLLTIKKIINLLLLSIARYLTFTIQYVILFYFLEIPIPMFDVFVLLFLYFLLISIIPTFILSEIGVRGSISLLLFSAYASSHLIPFEEFASKIVFISIAVWTINIILPSVMGSFFMFRLKLIGKWLS